MLVVLHHENFLGILNYTLVPSAKGQGSVERKKISPEEVRTCSEKEAAFIAVHITLSSHCRSLR